jgi:hypothetical protein
LCVCVCVCVSLSLSRFVATGKHKFCVLHVLLLRWTLWETQKLGECEELFADCAALQRICCSSDTSSCVQIALLHNSLFRQFCSCEFRLHFFTIHSSENFALVNSECSSSQFFLHTILLLGIQITLPRNSLFRELCSCEFRLHVFTIHSSDNFALWNSDYSSSQFILQRTLLLWIQIALLHNSFFTQFCSASELHCIALHCSWEFCSSETDIKSSMFKSFHRYLLALPTKARILCLDSL